MEGLICLIQLSCLSLKPIAVHKAMLSPTASIAFFHFKLASESHCYPYLYFLIPDILPKTRNRKPLPPNLVYRILCFAIFAALYTLLSPWHYSALLFDAQQASYFKADTSLRADHLQSAIIIKDY